MDIAKAIKMGKEKRHFAVSGGTLTLGWKEKDLYITDENGGKSKVTIADVNNLMVWFLWCRCIT
jgi:hypothetical protein